MRLQPRHLYLEVFLIVSLAAWNMLFVFCVRLQHISVFFRIYWINRRTVGNWKWICTALQIVFTFYHEYFVFI